MHKKTVRVTLDQGWSDDVMADAEARGIAIRSLEDFKAYAMGFLAETSRQLGKKKFIRTMTRRMRIRRRDQENVDLEFSFPVPTKSRFAT